MSKDDDIKAWQIPEGRFDVSELAEMGNAYIEARWKEGWPKLTFTRSDWGETMGGDEKLEFYGWLGEHYIYLANYADGTIYSADDYAILDASRFEEWFSLSQDDAYDMEEQLNLVQRDLENVLSSITSVYMAEARAALCSWMTREMEDRVPEISPPATYGSAQIQEVSP